jgi:hypothetical protein
VRRPDPANRDVPRGATLSSNRDLRARPQIGPDNANNQANPFDFEALTLKTLFKPIGWLFCRSAAVRDRLLVDSR